MPGPFPYQSTATVRSSGLEIDFCGPAPVYEVTVSYRGNLEVIPALFDSGASRTVIPHRVALAFNLRIITKNVDVGSAFGDERKNCWLCMADLSFAGLNFLNHPVISITGKEHILIGRDILNRYITTLNGPRLQFSVT